MEFLLGLFSGFIIGCFLSLLILNLIGYYNDKK